MNKSILLLLISTILFLSACSISANNENGSATEVILPVTKDLPQNQKVREIVLNVPTKEDDPIQYEYGFMMAEEWKKLGLDVKVEPLNSSSFSDIHAQKKEFDSLILTWNHSFNGYDPDSFINRLGANHGDNLSGYDHAEYNAMVDEQRKTKNLGDRKEIIKKAEEQLLENVPIAPIVHRNHLLPIKNEKFTNFTYTTGEGLNSFWTFMELEPKGIQKYVRWGYPSDLETLNPLASSRKLDSQVFRLVYDHLVRISETGEVKNSAATSIEDVNEDGKKYLIKLREDLTFHDGEKVTATDIKFSFDLVKESKIPAFDSLVEHIEKVEIVDELSVRFTLKQHFAPFLSETLSQIYILPHHIWQPIFEEKGGNGVLEDSNEKMIGSGPFIFDYWDPGQELKLDTNKNYFSQSKINGILRIPYENEEKLITDVINGNVEISGAEVTPIEVEKLNESNEMEVISVPSVDLDAVHFNIREKPFDDHFFRQALTLTIPREKIIGEILKEHAQVANGLIAPANESWHSSDLEGYEYNLEAAVNTLKDAGYKWNEKGEIYYPGKPK
ncbi:ABC transporter substrate-binding protein [Mesobacillus persicus]|uniref:ABC transporter substrate-binding protein n=1 Tax=Mesobacillus persicus TaxID=930146 RepID=UPI00147AB802|nr:ABC transporter substrate-binding protein [Mesobacillus persicus]